ncbi:baculoviral IAP repeat-containing protein 5.1-like [Leucoraja erinacea]|uniref:baculoviral IAP repeat-containing protein 5.1-like n=1 Tax=Leucoraja erinaceus TaxID=7782 RepID=UPI00245453F9|nr:baculoviral IAP repeat-containing protein 5.1-like [Leucoraja erinacea]
MVDHVACLLEYKLMYAYENRIATFRNWPFTENCCCTPENMAKAGFVHCPTENEPDVAKCFFCLKELDSWQPEYEPWVEHQLHSPACEFLALKVDVLDLMVEEFFRLEMERLRLYVKKIASEQVSVYRESVKAARVKVLESLTGAGV